MLFTDIIRRKRDGGELSATQIQLFVDGLADGSLPAEQVASLTMAIFLRSLSVEEAGMLTRAMATSGTVLNWGASALSGPVIDKHSTGGVGDKVSFMLAPIAAACGCFVPMISGRGLGHTGGTLDKIGAIPGYNATPDLKRFQQVVASVGCAIIGQTAELAPADRRLYAIRDVTGTVESIPLITASILSKKIAAGNAGLVMDIKVGSGAFMTTLDDARALARSLISTAASTGLKTHALITDMNQVLGLTAGNALEIVESMAYLRNEIRDARLDDVVLSLASEMLLLGGIESDPEPARLRAEQSIVSGRAAEIFAKMVSELGGPNDFMDRYREYVPVAGYTHAIAPPQAGYLASLDARAIGNAVIELGGGRRTLHDKLDLSVGFSDIAAVGAEVGPTHPLAIVHAANPSAAAHASHQFLAACRYAAEPPGTTAPVLERFTEA